MFKVPQDIPQDLLLIQDLVDPITPAPDPTAAADASNVVYFDSESDCDDVAEIQAVLLDKVNEDVLLETET